MSSLSSTSRLALLTITSARLFTTRKPILTPTCIISPHILVIAKQTTPRQRFGEHLRSIEKNLPGFPATEFQHSWSLDPRRSSSQNYALRGKRATEAPGDAPYFSPWHQSSARLKLRLPFRSQRPPAERAHCNFFFFLHGVGKHCNVSNALCNSSDEEPGPKCLEKNTNQNTALLFIIFLFFFFFFNIIHLRSDLEGNSWFCFPESPDVSQDEVERDIRTRDSIFLDFHFNSNQRITRANQNSRLGTYNNTNLIL